MTDFNKPLDTWVEEPVEIATMEPVIDKRGNVTGVKQGKRTVMQKVRYSKLSDPLIISCKSLNHDWYIPDKFDHVAHCRKCKKKQFIRAVYEKVVDGKILDRDTSVHLA